ncbi:hypothetical protein [Pseudomonas sp. R9.37]|uniref:hypothetical protein n=1 Tax=Pseudomonas sp. R9.37 TaxID=1390498 RepID=UPI0011B294F2|nr:hypothetical protein [Pseudomonas sp. R9.37]
MTSDVIQQYEAALQRLINNQPASLGVEISCDGVAKAALQTSSYGGKHTPYKVHAPINPVQRAQMVKDHTTS